MESLEEQLKLAEARYMELRELHDEYLQDLERAKSDLERNGRAMRREKEEVLSLQQRIEERTTTTSG